MMGAMTMSMVSSAFLQPGIKEAFDAIFEAGKTAAEHMKKASVLNADMEKLGMVNLSQGMVAAPFDVVSDYLRGMAGTMMDMYRHPDQLVRTCELIYRWQLETGKRTTGSAKLGNPKRVGTALHRGSDGFMSLKQFEKFYWPTFKQLVLDMVELGYVHIPFYEGNWEQRLEYMLDFPKGKTVARFALTDLKRTKEVLGGHTAIMGGVPHTMLQASTPNEIDAYCKDLIETVGKGGGFILSSSTGVTNEAKPENVAAMIMPPGNTQIQVPFPEKNGNTTGHPSGVSLTRENGYNAG
jgi:uroporphyrinogen-III decarboxylase